MIPYEEALALILDRVAPLAVEREPLERAAGRYLAADQRAREPLPRFDQSAVDGFGVRMSDLESGAAAEAGLKLVATLPAGATSRHALRAGETVKIFTGASVPRGVEAIVMKEQCEEREGRVRVRTAANPAGPCAVTAGANIRRRGAEFARGATVLAAGTRLTPPVVGQLATLGQPAVTVHRRPRVALLVTGNELVRPGEPLAPGQVRDANSYSLAAALRALGVDLIRPRRVRDDRRSLERHLASALSRADVVITVGGVSVGDFDYVKEVAEQLGVQSVFWRVAIKPGMPNYFGLWRAGARRGVAKPVWGLPGNPVSALVSFHQLVRPALLKMAGRRAPQRRLLTAMLADACVKKSGRLEWVRGVLVRDGERLVARPTPGQESHMLGGLAAADCLIHFPLDAAVLAAGALVEVELLGWGAD